MKRGTVFFNRWAGYPTYFIYSGHAFSSRREPNKSTGYAVTEIDGKWTFRTAQYYTRDLGSENMPEIGHIDLAEVVSKAILGLLGGKPLEAHGLVAQPVRASDS